MRGVKIAAGIWAAVGLFLVVWTISTAAAGVGSDDRYEEQLADAQRQQQFWKIVAGDGEGPTGAFNKLAMDLRTMDVEDLYVFRGDSNRYGGISEQLGFDPFNGSNCSECGPLDADVIETAVRVKNGALSEVLLALQPEKPSDPSGPPGGLWILWIFAGPAAIGGTFAIQMRQRERKYAEFGSELALIESIDDALQMPGLPEAQASDMRGLRDKLRENVEERVRYGDEEKRSLKLAELRREAEETLDALAEGNRTIGR